MDQDARMGGDENRRQVDVNYEAFMKMLPDALVAHANKYALMQDGEVIGFYSTLDDAYATARRFLQGQNFSVQRVTNVPVDLGFFSHAVHIG